MSWKSNVALEVQTEFDSLDGEDFTLAKVKYLAHSKSLMFFRRNGKSNNNPIKRPAYDRTYYRKHADEIRARKKAYRSKPESKEKMRLYRLSHKNRINECKRLSYKKSPELKRAYNREYYRKHKAKRKAKRAAYARQYRAEHRERVLQIQRKSRQTAKAKRVAQTIRSEEQGKD
jgi:hypothetical protein